VNNLVKDVAEDVLAAAKDGGVKAFIVKVLSCLSLSASSEPTPITRVPPRLPLGEDAREGLGAGRDGRHVRRREKRERKSVHREGFILSIVICQRRNPRHAFP